MEPAVSSVTQRSISVVIPAHNAAATIAEQLDALASQDCAELLEVIVVDSASTDTTTSIARDLEARWPKVRIVTGPGPGANLARNTGVRAARADDVLLCDADDVVASDWISTMSGGLVDADLVRGRYSLDLLNDAETIAARGSLASTSAPSDQRFGGLGGNCGFRRTAWEQLGGLREHHYGSDDAEFFWRAHEAGLRVEYLHDAVVHYRLRPGFDTLYRQQRTWAEGRALLYREFRETEFMQRRSTFDALRSWAWALRHLPDCRSADAATRGTWVRVHANNVGRAIGSARHRVYFP